MSVTVAGYFETKAQAEMAVKAMMDLGVQANYVKSSFTPNVMDWSAADPFASYSGSFSKAEDGLAGQATNPGGAALGILLAVDSPISTDRLSAESAFRRCGGRKVMQSERTWNVA